MKMVLRVILTSRHLKEIRRYWMRKQQPSLVRCRIDTVSLWGICRASRWSLPRVVRSKFVPPMKSKNMTAVHSVSGANSYSVEENELIYQKLKLTENR